MNCDDIMSQALEITRAQASIRPMSAAEIASYAAEIAQGIRGAMNPQAAEMTAAAPVQEEEVPAVDARKSIKEGSITCLECGEAFKVLTTRHLRTHGLDAKTYKKKWGLKANQTLACKALARDRRKRMSEHKIWEHSPRYQVSLPKEPAATADDMAE